MYMKVYNFHFVRIVIKENFMEPYLPINICLYSTHSILTLKNRYLDNIFK